MSSNRTWKNSKEGKDFCRSGALRPPCWRIELAESRQDCCQPAHPSRCKAKPKRAGAKMEIRTARGSNFRRTGLNRRVAPDRTFGAPGEAECGSGMPSRAGDFAGPRHDPSSGFLRFRPTAKQARSRSRRAIATSPCGGQRLSHIHGPRAGPIDRPVPQRICKRA
jgi:hypothetical protein